MESKIRLYFIFIGLLLSGIQIRAQYAPAAGQPGSTAVYKDSISIVAWASQCTVNRGWQDIANQSLGKTSIGSSISALGKADNDVISLGDGGTAVLQFAQAISNGPGPDFAVFENAFDDFFLELAFVEVSSDGLNYYRFPAHSLTQTNTQVGGFGHLQTTKIHNLAGKYKVGYGTPFDLEELKDRVGLDVMHITHIRIIDVVGSIDTAYASLDSAGNKINDPFPTPFPSGGFDLDAVGVLHIATSVSNPTEQNQVSVYPNPTKNVLYIHSQEEGVVEIYSMQGGKVLLQKRGSQGDAKLNISYLAKGTYLIRVINKQGVYTRQILKN